MKRCFLFTTAIALLLNTAICGEKKDPLQGTWSVVKMERGGRPAPKALLESSKLRVIIKGDTLRMTDEKRGESATFKRDDSKKPATIDLVFKEGLKEDVERHTLGIYEIDGDSLKLAWKKDGGDRPTKFASTEGDRTSELLVLKRDTKK